MNYHDLSILMNSATLGAKQAIYDVDPYGATSALPLPLEPICVYGRSREGEDDL